jgi:hypothetical protein
MEARMCWEVFKTWIGGYYTLLVSRCYIFRFKGQWFLLKGEASAEPFNKTTAL